MNDSLSLIALASSIADKAHEGQFRRDGVTPYITHPCAVALALARAGESDEVVATAWLHDVLEDTILAVDNLIQAGLPITVIQAVVVLTHVPTEPYGVYLNAVRNNPIALKVKVADMLHNLSSTPTRKQILKYARGLQILLG